MSVHVWDNSSLRRGILIFCSTVLGFIVMSFEMLGSRYLYPYFGGGLNTWAMLITVVLVALMVGYFIGGLLADRFPHTVAVASVVTVAGLYMLVTPFFADSALSWSVDKFGDGPLGAFVATNALLVLPLTFLSFFSPFSIRLLVAHASEAGRISGLMYAVSTAGNVAGVLVTSFYLIPSMGVRSITFYLGCVALLIAVLLAASGISLFRKPVQKQA